MKIKDEVTDAQRVELLTEARGVLERKLTRATSLLREWRDKYGGKEYHPVISKDDRILSASPTDLIRDTTRFLEGK